MPITRQILFAGLAGVISLLSLLGGSGIGQAYNLYPMTMILVGVLYVMGPVQRTLIRGEARSREFFLFLALVLIVGLWPAIKENGTMGIEYGWLLLLPYLIGQFKLSQNDARAMGFACGIFGLVVLAARVSLGIFDGWNRNTIAMAGFFGSAVCSAVPWTSWGGKIFHKALLVVVTLLILSLDSRSCLTGMLVLIALSFGILKPKFFAAKPWVRRLLLVMPVIIAVVTVLFQNSQMFDDLNTWSMEYFSKPIFNGRNTIWEHGMISVAENPMLGDGSIKNGYWHNCGITVLTAFGILGYAVWVLYFENIMIDIRYWKDDQCLCNCIAVFLVIMIQQSFELGLVSSDGSMLPYLILGIILGRIRYLKENKPVHHSR